MPRPPLLFAFIILNFAFLPALGQESGRLFFDAVPFAGKSSDSARLDLYLAVPYDLLRFERRDGIFIGRYQARMRVEGPSRTWYDSTFVRTVQTASFETTTGDDPAYEFYQSRVSLPPGAYTASVEVIDLRSNTPTTAKRAITATPPGLPFAMSGLLLVKKIREDSAGGYVISPMITESIDDGDDGYFLFFETYNATGRDRFKIAATYRDAAKMIGPAQRFEKTIPQGRSQQWVRLTTEGMPRGVFVVELKVTEMEDTTTALASAQRSVKFEGIGVGVPLAEEELDERVAQLRYVATQTEIDNIKNAPSLAERQRRYAEFWGRLDPTPATVENEAMNEYFRRVEHANTNFKSYAAGWLTDKGRIYIVYGAPDNISTDPFRNDGKMVETWHYYRRSTKLVFIDESGFGDFRLTTPVSSGERFRYDR